MCIFILSSSSSFIHTSTCTTNNILVCLCVCVCVCVQVLPEFDFESVVKRERGNFYLDTVCSATNAAALVIYRVTALHWGTFWLKIKRLKSYEIMKKMNCQLKKVVSCNYISINWISLKKSLKPWRKIGLFICYFTWFWSRIWAPSWTVIVGAWSLFVCVIIVS